MTSDIKKETIAAKNDKFRKTFLGGKVMLTAGVESDENLNKIIAAVKSFDNFTEENDPHKEKDFGKISIDGEDYFWKIDYYDKDYKFFQVDGHRVLTIMLASDY